MTDAEFYAFISNGNNCLEYLITMFIFTYVVMFILLKIANRLSKTVVFFNLQRIDLRNLEIRYIKKIRQTTKNTMETQNQLKGFWTGYQALSVSILVMLIIDYFLHVKVMDPYALNMTITFASCFIVAIVLTYLYYCFSLHRLLYPLLNEQQRTNLTSFKVPKPKKIPMHRFYRQQLQRKLARIFK